MVLSKLISFCLEFGDTYPHSLSDRYPGSLGSFVPMDQQLCGSSPTPSIFLSLTLNILPSYTPGLRASPKTFMATSFNCPSKVAYISFYSSQVTIFPGTHGQLIFIFVGLCSLESPRLLFACRSLFQVALITKCLVSSVRNHEAILFH